ncbi:hypothetical protein B0H13DRAFT_1874211 [Mycena leptocephala]|nr:hypothetical protein B0H13DRAFT_1874211 [Mycena leptocephala]
MPTPASERTSFAFSFAGLAPDVMALSLDRTFLACASRNGDINLFALQYGRHIHSFRVHAAVSALSWDNFTGDGATIFIGMKDGSLEGVTFNSNGKFERFLVLPPSYGGAVILITCSNRGVLAITSSDRMILRERKGKSYKTRTKQQCLHALFTDYEMGAVQTSTTQEVVRQWSSHIKSRDSKGRRPRFRDTPRDIVHCNAFQTKNWSRNMIAGPNPPDAWTSLHTAVFGPENLSDDELTEDDFMVALEDTDEALKTSYKNLCTPARSSSTAFKQPFKLTGTSPPTTVFKPSWLKPFWQPLVHCAMRAGSKHRLHLYIIPSGVDDPGARREMSGKGLGEALMEVVKLAGPPIPLVNDPLATTRHAAHLPVPHVSLDARVPRNQPGGEFAFQSGGQLSAHRRVGACVGVVVGARVCAANDEERASTVSGPERMRSAAGAGDAVEDERLWVPRRVTRASLRERAYLRRERTTRCPQLMDVSTTALVGGSQDGCFQAAQDGMGASFSSLGRTQNGPRAGWVCCELPKPRAGWGHTQNGPRAGWVLWSAPEAARRMGASVGSLARSQDGCVGKSLGRVRERMGASIGSLGASVGSLPARRMGASVRSLGCAQDGCVGQSLGRVRERMGARARRMGPAG